MQVPQLLHRKPKMVGRKCSRSWSSHLLCPLPNSSTLRFKKSQAQFAPLEIRRGGSLFWCHRWPWKATLFLSRMVSKAAKKGCKIKFVFRFSFVHFTIENNSDCFCPSAAFFAAFKWSPSKGRQDLSVPEYDFYGYYGHVKSSSPYESLLSQEYAKWAYSPRVSKAIKAEVDQCRNKAAIFDLSSFGKV